MYAVFVGFLTVSKWEEHRLINIVILVKTYSLQFLQYERSAMMNITFIMLLLGY